MKPCKHLDYREGIYGPDITLRVIKGVFPTLVQYWERGSTWTENGDGTKNPSKVQFCGAGRGRINGIFQCYNAGEMSCYEPDEEREGKDG